MIHQVLSVAGRIFDVAHGDEGLYYLTSPTERAIFIAGRSIPEIRVLAAELMLRGLDHEAPVQGHIWHDYLNSGKILIPTPEWQEPEQMRETMTRLADHVRTRFMA